MSEKDGVRDKTAGPQELVEAAGALRHISRVMGRAQERLGNFAAVGIWWGALTAVAVIVTFLLAFSGHATAGWLTALWVAHNVIGWSATLIILGQAGGVSRTVYKTCWVWAATTLAIWVVVWTAAWAEAVADWACWTLIQLVVGLALVSTGLIEGGKLSVGAGLLFVGSVPVILAFPTSAPVTSGILMGTVYGAFGILGWLGWRRERRAG